MNSVWRVDKAKENGFFNVMQVMKREKKKQISFFLLYFQLLVSSVLFEQDIKGFHMTILCLFALVLDFVLQR